MWERGLKYMRYTPRVTAYAINRTEMVGMYESAVSRKEEDIL